MSPIVPAESSEDVATGLQGARRDLAWMFGFGALWFALAALRPDATYHLAPVVVVACRPFFRWTAAPPKVQSVVGDVLGGAALAVVIATMLNLAGWDRGGVLFGGTAFVEAMILIGVTFALLVGLGLLLAGRTQGPH